MNYFFSHILIAFLAALTSTFAFADNGCDKSYALQVEVSGLIGANLCDSSSSSFVDSLKSWERTNLNYTQTSQAYALGRFNDVTVTLNYAANSTTLVYNFPELGHAGSFTGSTRDKSQQLFIDYLKKGGIIGQIMNYQSQHSPTSPISGAGGLVPMTIAGDFNTNFSNSTTAVAGPGGGSTDNLIGVQASYTSFSVDKTSDRVKVTSIPLSYTIRNNIDPRRQLIFSLPVTLLEVGASKTVQAGLGISYRVPLSDQWTLTPGAGFSGVGSVDRATLTSLYSASLTSTFIIPFSDFDISIGDLIGYYATGKFSAGDYSFNPDLKYTATRNGIMLSQPVNLLGNKLGVEYSLIDTRYLGNEKPYIDNFQEYSITLGTNKSALDARSFFRAGLTYTHGPGVNGFKANLGYWF